MAPELKIVLKAQTHQRILIHVGREPGIVDHRHRQPQHTHGRDKRLLPLSRAAATRLSVSPMPTFTTAATAFSHHSTDVKSTKLINTHFAKIFHSIILKLRHRPSV